MKKKKIITILLSIAAITANAQCRYCNTYEDFLDGRWQQLDTIYCESHSKNRQIWMGGSDYTLTTGDKAIDKILKKEAFAVMLADTIYVNCRNLQFEKTRFGSGYTKAIRIGQRSLLFVNRIIGSEAQSSSAMSSFMFGALGGARCVHHVAASNAIIADSIDIFNTFQAKIIVAENHYAIPHPYFV